MLTTLNMRNFKCFSEATIDFNNLTILAGGNSAGKSSVVQAFLFYAYAMNQNENSLNIRNIYDLDLGVAKGLISQSPSGADNAIEIEAIINNNAGSILLKTSMQSPYMFEVIKNEPHTDNSCIRYLKAERASPKVSTEISGSIDDLGYHGEYAPSIIENSDNSGVKINKKLVVADANTKFSSQVERWMCAILGNIEIDITSDYSKGFTDTKIRNSVTDLGVIPPLTGFGITYALPIVVAGLLCSAHPASMLIVENPEAHLHPMAQSNIGKFLAILAQCGVQVIIETHSEHVVDGARIQLKNDKQTDKMIINFFDIQKQKISIDAISLNDKGELSYWPKGFFDQKQSDLRELLFL